MAEFGTESCFDTINSGYNVVAVLDSYHVVVAYVNDNGYGCARAGLIDGNTVDWGDENIFYSGVASYLSIAALDSTHFVICYRNTGTQGAAKVGIISGNTISSYGSENIYNSGGTIYTDVSALDSTHFVIAYRDISNSNYGTAIVGLVSGTTISSYGAENVFNSATTGYLGVSKLDSTHFVVAYTDTGNSSYGTAIVGLVSGTTISSYGSANVFNSAITVFIEASYLDSTHFVLAYRDDGNATYGTAIVGLVSGTTISSYGAENVYCSAGSNYMGVSRLDDTHFVASYTKSSDGSICARKGTVSGTTISSYDTEVVANSASTNNTGTAAISETDYIVVYKDDGGDDYGCARIWGTTPSKQFTTESCFNTVNTEYNAVAMLDQNHVVVAYKDTGSDGYGCARIGVIADDTVTWGVENIFSSETTHDEAIDVLDSTHFVVSYKVSSGGKAIVGEVSGITISSYGSEVEFSNVPVNSTIAALDSTHFVVAYSDFGNSQYGTARVGSVSGTAITYGSENVFKSADSRYMSISVLDSTHFMVAYQNYLDYYGYSIVGLVSGTTISSYGSEVGFNSGDTSNISSAGMGGSYFVISYCDIDNSYYGTAKVGSVSGTAISYGSANVYNSGNTTHTSVSALDDTHFVTAYRDNSNSNQGTTKVGTISGTTINSYGSSNIFNSDITIYIGITSLSSTDYVVVYKDDGGDDYGCARVWQTFDNNEFGTEVCFNTVNTSYNSVAMLDDTHVISVYKDTGGLGYGCARVGIIEDNTISWGTESTFNNADTDYISVAALDDTRFVIAYRDVSNSNYGTTIVGSISETNTINYGAEVVFNSGSTYYISVAALDSGIFVIGYCDIGNFNYGTAIIGAVAGTTIGGFGSENVFNAAVSNYISVSALDSTHFVVGYQDAGNANHGTGIVGLVSGTTISSYGSENVFNSTNTSYIAISSLDATHFVAVYTDVGGGSNSGCAKVGSISGVTISYGAENVYSSIDSYYNDVISLDDTHFTVIYSDYDNSGYGTVISGVVKGITITYYGSEVIFNSAVTDQIACAAITPTDYVIIYRDNGGADYGCSRVWGSLSGWSGIIMGISSPAKVSGIEIANITSVIGIS